MLTDLPLLLKLLAATVQNMTNSAVLKTDIKAVVFPWLNKGIYIDSSVGNLAPPLEILGLQFR